jgi:MraZ protein
MFYGNYQLTLDGKGRIIIPSKYRSLLEAQGVDQLLITVIGPCLALFPPGEWKNVMGALSSQPPFHSAVMSIQRMLSSNTDQVAPDKQGRLLIPQQLRYILKGEREIRLIGVQNRMEIWPASAWEEFLAKANQEFQDWGDRLPWQPPR